MMLRTACYDWHVERGGRMVDFAGWEMPVQYTSITDEHRAVRTAAGLFDIAHMGRLKFTGSDACRFLDYLTTNDVPRLKLGQVRYALVANNEGGILDDVLVYRFGEFYLLVVNASNRQKIVDWIKRHQDGFDVAVDDVTFEQFMLALQGPKSQELLAPLIESDLSGLKYYTACETRVLGEPALVSRTGYTGEDGFEIITPAGNALTLWQAIVDAGGEQGLLPAGLGCRDTLRLEAAMPLYGHEMDESTDPFSAGLSFAVNLDGGDFLGKQSLADTINESDRPKRVGLELEGRRIAREGAIVYAVDRQVGKVTSGTFSPTLGKSIAMAYVPSELSALGSQLEVDIRGKRHKARVVPLPFYSRRKK